MRAAVSIVVLVGAATAFAAEQLTGAKDLEQQATRLYEQGRISESIAILQAAERRFPRDVAVESRLALSYCAINDERRARIYLKRVRSAAPLALAPLASCFLQAEDYAGAYLAYMQGKRASANVESNVLIGIARSLMGISKESLARLEQLRGNEPYLRAVQAVRAGDATAPDEALPLAYRQAPHIVPTDTMERLVKLRAAHGGEAAFAYVLGVRAGQAAIEMVAECEKAFPDSVPLLRWEAEMLAEQGELEKAAEMLKKAASGATPTFELHRDLGLTYYRLKDFTAALAEFREMLRLQPNSEESKAAVSRCLIQLNQDQEDADLLKPLIDLPHPPQWALLDWSVVQVNLAHPSEAIAALRQLEALTDADPSIHYRLSRLYRTVGDASNSERELAAFKRLSKGESASAATASSPADK